MEGACLCGAAGGDQSGNVSVEGREHELYEERKTRNLSCFQETVSKGFQTFGR